jgi:putative membrane protein
MLRRAALLPLSAVAVTAALAGSGSIAAGQGRPAPKRIDVRCTERQFSAWDQQWLMTSIQGDRFEIHGGNLARSRGATPIVRELGARLVGDHSKSLASAKELAHKLGVPVPGEPTPSQQWELRVVAQFEGSAFDRWYSDLEVQDHRQDIEETTAEIQKGCNPEARAEARSDLPVLQTHLRLARAALAAVGGAR